MLKWMLLFTSIALAQDAFEVASVKPSKLTSGRFTMGGDAGRINYTNIPLKRVLLSCFDLKNYQIVGPDWLDTLRFDITAKIPEGSSKEQINSMMQNLLATRFGMKIHRESKQLPIYALLVAKNGMRIKPKSDDSAGGEEQIAVVTKPEGKDGFPVVSLPGPGLIIETKSGRGRISAKDIPLTRLADFLSGQVGRPVMDRTGVAGDYSFEIYFTPESAAPSESPEPSLFVALQEQLGLRLEARKGAVELLVIDRIERVPTEN